MYFGVSCDEYEVCCGDDVDEFNDGCSWCCDGSGWDVYVFEGLSGVVDGLFGEFLLIVGDEDYV